MKGHLPTTCWHREFLADAGGNGTDDHGADGTVQPTAGWSAATNHRRSEPRWCICQGMGGGQLTARPLQGQPAPRLGNLGTGGGDGILSRPCRIVKRGDDAFGGVALGTHACILAVARRLAASGCSRAVFTPDAATMPSARDLIADSVRQAVRAGQPVDKVRVLARRHGVALGTVRIALAHLASAGWLTVEHGRGCRPGPLGDPHGIPVALLTPSWTSGPAGGFLVRVADGLAHIYGLRWEPHQADKRRVPSFGSTWPGGIAMCPVSAVATTQMAARCPRLVLTHNRLPGITAPLIAPDQAAACTALIERLPPGPLTLVGFTDVRPRYTETEAQAEAAATAAGHSWDWIRMGGRLTKRARRLLWHDALVTARPAAELFLSPNALDEARELLTPWPEP